jgi:hypothetical protein
MIFASMLFFLPGMGISLSLTTQLLLIQENLIQKHVLYKAVTSGTN